VTSDRLLVVGAETVTAALWWFIAVLVVSRSYLHGAGIYLGLIAVLAANESILLLGAVIVGWVAAMVTAQR
jgi:hypothetical protein